MRNQQSRRFGWKVFAALSIALFAGGAFTGRDKPVAYPWVDWVGLPIEFIALIGLVAYAFMLPAGRTHFWRNFALAYPVWVLISIGVMFIRKPEMHDESMRTVGYVGAVFVAFALAIPTWIAIRRIGKAQAKS